MRRAALDKKASDLVVLDVGELTSIADYFVICIGPLRHAGAGDRASTSRRRCRKRGRRPLAIEGCATASGC